MSLNNSSNWNGGNKEENNQSGQNAGSQNTNAQGLVGLFQQTSMTSDNRNLKDVTDVREQIIEFYKTQKSSTTSQLQQQIIPEVEAMTATISPQLPGLCFYREIQGQMYVMGVLFSNNNLAISTEQINVAGFGGNGSQRVSIPLTPADYANGQVIEGIRNHYRSVASARQINTVNIINVVVADLEMYTHAEIVDAANRIDTIANWLTREWEEAILVKAAEQATAAQISLPSPFKENKPFGNNNAAEARVNVVSGRLNTARQLSPANMEVIVSTMNPNSNSQSQNSKEIARIKATVSLKGVSFQEHQQALMANQNAQQNFMQMMGLGGSVYPNGYRPLRPVITLDQVQSGEQMNYNGGLAPYFFGLFALMCTNNNYVFAEALRRVSVGARGNLSDLEVRINQLLQGSGVPNPQNRIQLTDKTISDTDVVNQWIRQNVAPHATFQTNLVLRGVNGSVNNFLLRLAGGAGRGEAINTVVNCLDAISNGAASTLIARNHTSGKGWTKDKPILHRTAEIAINGLATYGDKQLNTLEIDEMLLGHVKGKNGINAIADFLRVQYGTDNEEFKSRAQKLRIQLNESLFDGAVHINNFSQVHIWDPLFMQLLGECMADIGAMNVANNLGSFRTTNLVYAPGAGLATYASAGSNGNVGGMMASGFFNGVPFA
ncbi:hypothetical protein RISINGSUN_28 [Erwinia phage vB_EamM_RisingSun]|uniref:Uncharacterized protein n=2 Tax=Risingsunvirus risingsun TaxID=2560435 RepID=A0A223LI37_9CAUD|nr:nuclear shell protein [Erwinia phage vB_EamM_RisingSun]ASU03642.1 hypothetical protein RISINGSUN_28 [Erwinia phage vB_EamM_RisingSun]ASU03887.1 hypothetical protein JOAD_28 [Erwinia phage vB_EamM_Joad]